MKRMQSQKGVVGAIIVDSEGKFPCLQTVYMNLPLNISDH